MIYRSNITSFLKIILEVFSILLSPGNFMIRPAWLLDRRRRSSSSTTSSSSAATAPRISGDDDTSLLTTMIIITLFPEGPPMHRSPPELWRQAGQGSVNRGFGAAAHLVESTVFRMR
jgi:hypothetical protein